MLRQVLHIVTLTAVRQHSVQCKAAYLQESGTARLLAEAQLQLCRRILLSDGMSCLLGNRLLAGAGPAPCVCHAVNSTHTHQQVLLRVKCDKAKAA